MKFNIEVQGTTEYDIQYALEEVTRLITEGNIAGANSNEIGSFKFESTQSS